MATLRTSALDGTHWQQLGAVEPGQLLDSRLALHNAVQLLASFGQTLLEARADDSHRSVTWEGSGNALVSDPSPDGLRAALRLGAFTLELRNDGGVVADLDLRGRPVEEARHWLGVAVGEARGSEAVDIGWPEYDVPAPPGGVGSPLVPDAAALEELARWYADAALILDAVLADAPEASPVRCWPHHFDLATLLTFAGTAVGEEACYVGVGMSPGDESQAAPYVYVNGSPPADPNLLPELRGAGHWNTEGWVGAVLPAEAVVAERRPAEQAALARAFVAEAVSVMRGVVLGARGTS